MSSKIPAALIGLGLVLLSGLAASWALSRRKKWRPVGKLSKMYIYPIKSGRYREIMEAECTPIGLRYKVGDGKYLRDRVFVVYNARLMKFVSSKYNPKVLPMNVEPKDDKTVILSYPGKTSFEVTLNSNFDSNKIEMWMTEKIKISDCGDDVAKWVSNALEEENVDFRLGYWPEEEDTWRRDITFREKELKVFKYMANKYTGAYADLSSYLILNVASIDDLNSRLEGEENKANPLSFRPNFIIEGTKPYEEDKWQWMKIGNSVFRSFKPCTRCMLITIDPDTGLKNPKNEPFNTLRKYRTMKMLGEERIDPHSPVMGLYFGLQEGRSVKCGDTVYVSD